MRLHFSLHRDGSTQAESGESSTEPHMIIQLISRIAGCALVVVGATIMSSGVADASRCFSNIPSPVLVASVGCPPPPSATPENPEEGGNCGGVCWQTYRSAGSSCSGFAFCYSCTPTTYPAPVQQEDGVCINAGGGQSAAACVCSYGVHYWNGTTVTTPTCSEVYVC